VRPLTPPAPDAASRRTPFSPLTTHTPPRAPRGHRREAPRLCSYVESMPVRSLQPPWRPADSRGRYFRCGMAACVLAFAVFGLPACASSDRSGQPRPPGLLAEGRVVFAASCVGCHTLRGNDTQASGGDLGFGYLTQGQIESFTRIMPVHPTLSRASIAAVAKYVAAVQQSHSR
jgi:mono/diheme cytochrome c family protein